MRRPWAIFGLVGLTSGLAWSGACGTIISPFPKKAAWTARTVSAAAGLRPAVVTTADIDNDGRTDVICGYAGVTGVSDPRVAILFQNSVDSFEAVVIGASGDLAGITALAVADLDGDTHQDVVAACNGRLIYLHSPVTPRTAAGWTLSTFDGSSGVGVGQWNDVAVGDIDGAEGPDLVACNGNNGWLSWFRSPAVRTSGVGWTRFDIDATTRSSAASVLLDDVDGDGRIDVISTAPGETTARTAWYKNPTNPATDPWTKTAIGNAVGPARLALADVNQDGRKDVVVTLRTTVGVGWYQKPTNPLSNWSGYLLTQYNANVPTDVKLADIDGNGQVDAVVSTRENGTLRWFTPIGAQTAQWYENNLQDMSNFAVGRIALADIDGDGRPDVVAPLQGPTSADDRVVWYENPEP